MTLGFALPVRLEIQPAPRYGSVDCGPNPWTLSLLIPDVADVRRLADLARENSPVSTTRSPSPGAHAPA